MLTLFTIFLLILVVLTFFWAGFEKAAANHDEGNVALMIGISFVICMILLIV